MKALTFDIKPLEGFGELDFGSTPEQIIAYLGEPEEKENLTDEEMGDSIIFHYDEKGISAFLEVLDEPVLTTFETDNPAVTLFGKRIFAMKEDEIVKLMKNHGYSDFESEMLEDDDEYQNEKMISFDEALIDFYFEDDILTAVSWGIFIDDEDEDDEDDD